MNTEMDTSFFNISFHTAELVVPLKMCVRVKEYGYVRKKIRPMPVTKWIVLQEYASLTSVAFRSCFQDIYLFEERTFWDTKPSSL
jgi:hypothetical protein